MVEIVDGLTLEDARERAMELLERGYARYNSIIGKNVPMDESLAGSTFMMGCAELSRAYSDWARDPQSRQDGLR
jgi:hypothetical protein